MPQMMPHMWIFIFFFFLLLFLLMIIFLHFFSLPSVTPSSPTQNINKWAWRW